MARIRTIKPDFFKDSKLAKLSERARLLYVGLWTIADDNGIGPGDIAIIRSEVFPYDEETAKTRKAFDELIANGRVITYEVSEEQYFFIPTFHEHQRVDYTKAMVKFPLPDGTKPAGVIYDRNNPEAIKALFNGSQPVKPGEEPAPEPTQQDPQYPEEVYQLKEFASTYFDPKYMNGKELDCFDKLLRIDKYTVDQVKTAISSAKEDNFWERVFMSPMKLRDKDKNGVKYMDKFLQIKPKGNAKPSTNDSNCAQPTVI